MSGDEMRTLGPEELTAKEGELREQLFRLRFQVEMGQTDGLKKYRVLRRDLARVLTVRTERGKAARQG
jgi:large subunit ribosomal protein L29